MIDLPQNNLTQEKLRMLIRHAQKKAIQDETRVEAVDYDWMRPHHFSRDQLAMLDIFARKTQEKLTDTLDTLCQGPFTITMKSVSEHFASLMAADVAANRQSDYFLPIITEDREHCGFISLSMETAAKLVALMLREADKIDSGRKLSGLEDSILFDITSAMVECFAEALKKRNGPKVDIAAAFVKGVWPADFEGMEDIISFTYDVDSPVGKFDFTFTTLAGILEPVAGIDHNDLLDQDPKKVRNRIMSHVNRVPVKVTGMLCATSISLNDIMNLEAGDVVLLGQKVSKPFDVLLNDRRCFKSFPAAYCGKYAVVIAPAESE